MRSGIAVDGRAHSGPVRSDVDQQAETVTVPAALLADTIAALEQHGCQFFACEGPTLEPKDMITCAVCATVARLRVAIGRPACTDDEIER